MKILEKSFRSKGFFHEQIWRDNGIAIYKRWRTTAQALDPHFEVIIIKNHEAYRLGDAIIEAGEQYPGANGKWGIDGFTYKTLKEAQTKVNQIESARIKKK